MELTELLTEIPSQIFQVWLWMMDHLLYINLFLSVVIVFFQRRDPKAVWTWLLALYFVFSSTFFCARISEKAGCSG